MLGLGTSVMTSGAPLEWTPESMSNLTLWLKANENITADQDSSANPISHSTKNKNMEDEDKINAWNAFGSTSINAVQTTQADKPLWETDAADFGAVHFYNSIKYLDLSSDIVLDANTDFTIAIRFKCVDISSKVLIGSSGSEFIRLNSNTVIRLRVDASNDDFTLASSNLATDKYIILIIVRSDGATGNVNLFIRGADSGYFDGTATGTQFGSEAQSTGEITISNIGASADDTSNLSGFMSDVIIWDGTAASSKERKEIFDYIEAQ